MFKKVILAGILVLTSINTFAGEAKFWISKDPASTAPVSYYTVYYGPSEQSNPELYPYSIDVTVTMQDEPLTGTDDLILINTNLEDGTDYYFAVKDIYTNGSESDYFSLPYPVEIPPAVEISLTETNLIWSHNTDMEFYQIIWWPADTEGTDDDKTEYQLTPDADPETGNIIFNLAELDGIDAGTISAYRFGVKTINYYGNLSSETVLPDKKDENDIIVPDTDTDVDIDSDIDTDGNKPIDYNSGGAAGGGGCFISGLGAGI